MPSFTNPNIGGLIIIKDAEDDSPEISYILKDRVMKYKALNHSLTKILLISISSTLALVAIYFSSEFIVAYLLRPLTHPEDYADASAEVTNRYCQNNLLSELNAFNASPRRLPSDEYLKFCTSQFISSISGLNDTYTLPTTSNPHIVLNRENTMFRPARIASIQYKEVITASLWVLTIKDNSDIYRLAFTDLKRFHQAKADISEL